MLTVMRSHRSEVLMKGSRKNDQQWGREIKLWHWVVWRVRRAVVTVAKLSCRGGGWYVEMDGVPTRYQVMTSLLHCSCICNSVPTGIEVRRRDEIKFE